MRTTLLLHSLRRGLKPTIFVSLVMAALNVGAMLLYSEEASQALNEARAQSPFLFAALGLSGSATLLEFLSSLTYGLLFPLLGTLLATSLATRLLAKVVERGEITHYLALPIRRSGFVAIQAGAVALLSLLPAALAFGSVVASLYFKPEFSANLLWLMDMNLSLYGVLLVLGMLSLLIASGADSVKRARMQASSLGLLLLAVGLVSLPRQSLTWLRYGSYYWLYAPQEAAVGRLGLKYLVLPLAALVLGLLAMTRFSRRELD